MHESVIVYYVKVERTWRPEEQNKDMIGTEFEQEKLFNGAET